MEVRVSSAKTTWLVKSNLKTMTVRICGTALGVTSFLSIQSHSPYSPELAHCDFLFCSGTRKENISQPSAKSNATQTCSIGVSNSKSLEKCIGPNKEYFKKEENKVDGFYKEMSFNFVFPSYYIETCHKFVLESSLCLMTLYTHQDGQDIKIFNSIYDYFLPLSSAHVKTLTFVDVRKFYPSLTQYVISI